ncbi:class I SAM-dependent methyltransferase [Actinoplanes sp. NPDC023714]|uniref:class I SAM-dependent methyltransferase n=1 Tax=Actinoplanes sp. NPDC023714 TaxID=3154322 RepID=UPI0033E71F16
MPHAHGHHGHPHAPHAHGHQHGGDTTLRNVLDLDAEVARPQLEALTAHIADRLGDHPVRTILDIGAGTGTGTFALLERFPSATATTVDTADDMLEHLTGSAARHGLADRITMLRADLDAGWPETGKADLIWASSSMHHMADPDRVLRDIRAALEPGGLFVMIEMESMPRFLPPGFAGDLEERCLAAAAEAKAEHLPHLGSPWSARLAEAGFTLREERTLTVELPAPLTENALRYATTILARYRATLTDRLTGTDLAALDELLEPGSLQARTGLTLRSTRDVWLAR